jgi:hypothetical protein
MADKLRDALATLGQRMKANASSEITYRRGGASIVGLLATRGNRDVDGYDSQGMLVTVTFHDFIVDAAGLEIDDSRFLPERGDRIEAETDGVLETFEVSSGLLNMAVYRYTDSTNSRVRIHTTLKRAEDAPEEEL